MPIHHARTKEDVILALTMGEPGGIGGELTLKVWSGRELNNCPAFFVIDSPDRLKKLAERLGWDIKVEQISSPEQTSAVFNQALPVLNVGEIPPYSLGSTNSDTATAVCRSIEMAVEFVSNKQAHAIVTNPIQKNALYDAGFKFPGHTEYLAHLSGGNEPVMMLASPELRVVPLSIHQSIVEAVTSIDTDTIVRKTRIAYESLKMDYGISSPQIAIAGLNPHAGEDGTMGREEIDIINPAIEILRKEGMTITGPVPPDALFMERMRPSYDVAICHYHDQALIPIKALDVDRAVNVTIGLPIIRTSPDHGTALDIAGTGKAEPNSLIAALHVAAEIAMHRNNPLQMAQ